MAAVALAVDTTFGQDGVSRLDVRPRDEALEAERLPDGKFVIVGTTEPFDGTTSSSAVDGLVARFNVDGTPDSGFGANGVVIVPLAAPHGRLELVDAVPLPDGKLLVAGTRIEPADSPNPIVRDVVLARFNPDGTPDVTFGAGGTGVRFAVSQGQLYDIVALPDGTFFAGGYKSDAASGMPLAATWRFSADGTPDPSFGTAGEIIYGTPQNGLDRVAGLVVRPDGDINGVMGALLVTFRPDGTPKPSADPPIDRVYPDSLTLQSDGKLLLARMEPANSFTLARVLADGVTRDPGFQSEYHYNIGGDSPRPSGLAVTPDGQIIVAAYTTTLVAPGRLVDRGTLLRVRPDGSPDPAFDGTMSPVLPWSIDGVMRPFVTPEGRLYVAGESKDPAAPPNGLHDLMLAGYRIDPPLSVDVGGPYTPDEGAPFGVTASATYAGGQVVNYEWDQDYRDDTFTANSTGASTAIVADDDSPAPRVMLRVTTSDGLVAQVAVPVVPRNVAPAVVSFDVPELAAKGQEVSMAGTIADPGADQFTLTMNFGDGTVVSGPPLATRAFYPRHTFVAGTWDVTATVRDDEGATAIATRRVRVVDLTGTAFDDADDNGRLDAADPRRAGETVYIDADDDGTFDAGERSTTTDAKGRYFFDGVAPGSYVLRHVAPPGWRYTTQLNGRAPVTVTATTGAAVDFGLTQTSRITGTVFNDPNGNGARDPNEGQLPRAVPYIDVDNDGHYDPAEPTGVLDADGKGYSFANLDAGTYVLRFDVEGTPYQIVTAPGGGAGRVVQLPAATVAEHVDFGVAASPAFFRGTVYYDADHDGKYLLDRGVAGATVFDDADGNGVLDPDERRARADGGGSYSLGVMPGPHNVRVLGTDGWAPSSPATGSYASTAVSGSPVYLHFGLLPTLPPAVVGRHLFNDPDPSISPPTHPQQADAVIAPDKVALSPGSAATTANVSDLEYGITGVLLDLRRLPGDPPLNSDFVVRAGRGGNPASWMRLPDPSYVTTRAGDGPGGSDRVEIRFTPGLLQNTWVQVTIAANERTGLPAPDVFYFGSLVGNVVVGQALSAFVVDSRDLAAVLRRVALRSGAPAGPNDPYDVNRDGVVDLADVAAVRRNIGKSLAPLTAPATALPTATPAPLFSGRRVRPLRRTAAFVFG